MNARESALECTICGELEGVSRKAIESPELLKKLKMRVAQQHAGCERFKGNPARAKLERQFDKRLQAEMRGIA